MTRKEELELRAAQWLQHHGDQRLTRPLAALLEQVEREVLSRVIQQIDHRHTTVTMEQGTLKDWCMARYKELT